MGGSSSGAAVRRGRGGGLALDPLHQQVAAVVLRVAARHGFALAGGNALMAHGVINRPTQDVDCFTDRELGVPQARDVVERALLEAGFRLERVDLFGDLGDVFEGAENGMAEWIVTAGDGRQTVLQLSFFARTRGPVGRPVRCWRGLNSGITRTSRRLCGISRSSSCLGLPPGSIRIS